MIDLFVVQISGRKFGATKVNMAALNAPALACRFPLREALLTLARNNTTRNTTRNITRKFLPSSSTTLSKSESSVGPRLETFASADGQTST